MARVYLDHNATTPLRAEARAAMVSAMDLVGNPSSVHAEGRAAKMLVERARGQVAELVGCRPQQVIFTSSATEAAALAVAQKARHGGVYASLPTEHDCLSVWSEHEAAALHRADGTLFPDAVSSLFEWVDACDAPPLIAWSAANSETGIMARTSSVVGSGATPNGKTFSVICDITQMAGKVPVAYEAFTPSYAILSAHKIGGPKGIGALINFTAQDPDPILRGGGQEMNRRSGTENIVGMAGFGAAAQAALRDVAAGKWDEVAQLRSILEKAIASVSDQTIFVGNEVNRLPNTSCILTPGWKGETQVMQMDLAGFAISAGSACSSGKVKASKVLLAMGYDEIEAASAVRVSLGLETTEDDVLRFADAWAARFEKHQMRAA
ncbi:cysteine desulfurase family protein [Sulfitobacter guttiformis]|uniref:Cysteine desulfurase n=1 Tax=Sulfitobacter guttiformis TaxID=74349 RepID=A0A420DHW5_9RHOB|nr:aminotransferase class V-fold PLP-dependent enzyme [Sulfitobacter guttiformis]KIN72427.1 Cysteine desulfurase [Sulfitobacter guttiformis KCTC 32187]RKE93821.1 cysteine desulfurase [Sulfitobacter guttiformis]